MISEDNKWQIRVGDGKQLYTVHNYGGKGITDRQFGFGQVNEIIDDFYVTYGMVKLYSSADARDEAIEAFIEKMGKITGDTSYNWRRFFYCLVGMIS